jgi:DNA-binding LytR/AlgR family response regulator
MNAILIDDDPMARAVMLQMAVLFPEVKVIEEFSNAISAIKYLNQNQVDLVFLDIHMPDFTGIDFIKTIKNPPQIILVTADKNFAIEAFEYECIVDYLVKPITEKRFEKTLNKLKQAALQQKSIQNRTFENSDKPADEFFINIDRRLVKIEYSNINIIEAKGDYVFIKTEKENYKVHTTLKKIEDKLPSRLFLKVHRSFIINFKKIIDIEDNSVLISKHVIPVSRSNRPELMSQLNLL